MFFDKFIFPVLKYGVPSHHFIAEEFNNCSSKLNSTEFEEGSNSSQFFAVALAIFNLENVLEDFINDFIFRYRVKYSDIIDADTTVNMEKKKEVHFFNFKRNIFFNIFNNFLNKKYTNTVVT